MTNRAESFTIRRLLLPIVARPSVLHVRRGAAVLVGPDAHAAIAVADELAAQGLTLNIRTWSDSDTAAVIVRYQGDYGIVDELHGDPTDLSEDSDFFHRRRRVELAA